MGNFIERHPAAFGLLVAMAIVGGLLGIREVFQPRTTPQSPPMRVRIDFNDLELVAEYYERSKGVLPPTLESLTKPISRYHVPMLTERSIIDPWGRPYQYDPAQIHPKTGKALIWTEGEYPGNPGSKITNWELKRK